MSLARREWLLGAAGGLGLLMSSPSSQAGAQVEEPLIDSVRTALSGAASTATVPVASVPWANRPWRRPGLACTAR